MQSIRRTSADATSSSVSGFSLSWYNVTAPVCRFVTRTHGISCRRSSRAMYSTLDAMFMCQWIPDRWPMASSPPPVMMSRLMGQCVDASSYM